LIDFPGRCVACGSAMRLTLKQCAKALQAKVAQEGLVLTKAQVVALGKTKTEKEAQGEGQLRDDCQPSMGSPLLGLSFPARTC
jgi:hypothetical protein